MVDSLRVTPACEDVTMTRNDPDVRSANLATALLLLMAFMFVVLAVWTVMKGDLLEAVGHALVAILGLSAAFLLSSPDRPRVIQKRITIGALTLVPIILAIFAVSIFL